MFAELAIRHAQGCVSRSGLLDILTIAAVLGSGSVAGIFFALSTFVMRALGRLPQNQGMAAMNAINITIFNPWFFFAFFGTGPFGDSLGGGQDPGELS